MLLEVMEGCQVALISPREGYSVDDLNPKLGFAVLPRYEYDQHRGKGTS